MAHQDMSRALAAILDNRKAREDRAAEVADLIRSFGPYRWAGLYDVDMQQGLVLNLAWSGPNQPEFPTFPITKGLTSRAISTKSTVNVGNVAEDRDYLTALATTQSEIIVPILLNGCVVGTLDVESETPNAFDYEAQDRLEQLASLIARLWETVKND